MKNTNFERVEHTQGDVHTEQVIVHTKKRHRRWRLKLLSAVLALLIWLLLANIDQDQPQDNDTTDPSCLGESVVEVI